MCVSRPVTCDSVTPWTVARQAPLCPWDSPGRNTGVGCHALFQGIFPTWGMNLGLLVIKSTEISQQDRSSASNPKETTTDRLAVPLDRCEVGKNVRGVSSRPWTRAPGLSPYRVGSRTPRLSAWRNFPDLSAEAWTPRAARQFCWAGQTGICGTGFWGGQSYPEEELQTRAEGPHELSEGSEPTQRKCCRMSWWPV